MLDISTSRQPFTPLSKANAIMGFANIIKPTIAGMPIIKAIRIAESSVEENFSGSLLA